MTNTEPGVGSGTYTTRRYRPASVWPNAILFSGFAGVALLIAVVGVAGVLAFSVSARTREFGVRLAMGSTPRHLLTRVLREGAAVLIASAIVASVTPAARASRVDVIKALRSE